MTFRVGDIVASTPDAQWGIVETRASGPAGHLYGVRFGDGGAAVRTGQQLNLSAYIVGKMPFSDLFTPGELKADIAALSGRVRAFGDDVSSSPTSDDKVIEYRRRFVGWFNQYFEWFESINGWFSYTLNSTRDRARQYSDELGSWIAEWTAMGGKVVSRTAISAPAKDIGGRGRDQQSPDGDFLSTALLVGGLGLGALVVMTALKK